MPFSTPRTTWPWHIQASPYETHWFPSPGDPEIYLGWDLTGARFGTIRCHLRSGDAETYGFGVRVYRYTDRCTNNKSKRISICIYIYIYLFIYSFIYMHMCIICVCVLACISTWRHTWCWTLNQRSFLVYSDSSGLQKNWCGQPQTPWDQVFMGSLWYKTTIKHSRSSWAFNHPSM